MTDKLRECPFCGGAAEWRAYDPANSFEPFGLTVEHRADCLFVLDVSEGDAAFKEAWNQRPEPKPTADVVEASPPSDDLVKRLMPADFEKPDLSVMHRSELEAEVVHLAKLCERFRQSITLIVRKTEDEGDRTYFGSTNDADELRELDTLLTDAGNELFMPWMNGDDLYAELRELRKERAEAADRIEQQASQIAELRAALDAFDAVCADIGGCSDGYCIIQRPKGMHTNGGCRCSEDRNKMRRFAPRARHLAETIRQALAENPDD